jgi:hypothetical protein
LTSTETIIRLSVQPMSAPRPALRYLLLPELRELSPGNPIPNYVRCVLALEQSPAEPQAAERRQKLLVMPLERLPARELTEYGGATLRQADRAARMEPADWQVLSRLRIDGIGVLLPDIQKLRLLAQDLRLRFRAEVALHRYDDALGSARTLFAMARHAGEHPTLVGDLVGIAIANVAIGPLEEMLEQPGCPNLYWALTDLPDPLVSLQRGMQGERIWVRATFHGLDDRAPMSKQQIRDVAAMLRRAAAGVRTIADRFKGVAEWLDARSGDEAFVRAARQRLVEGGIARELVQQFLPAQVVLLDDWRLHEVHRDEAMKLTNLPAWQMEALATRTPPTPSHERAVFDALLSSVQKVRRAQARLEQRIGLLRHVEVLRLYAAAHDGRFPSQLADVGVPLPADPFTGKPFEYRLQVSTAHVRGSPPPGEEKNPVFNVRYEVTIRH